jgi:asparagine synthase (glutamine-hydrolysing)
MFAFGLWDSQHRHLVLCRDRFGIKPLSYYEDDDILVFSSEVKAIAPWVRLSADSHVTSAYLAGFGGPTRDRSFFSGISILGPGMIREHRSGVRTSERSFFQLTDFWQKDDCERMRRLDDRSAVDELEKVLIASVEKHLISDAPVGAFCSGGLDSSLVMAMASRVHPNLAIFHANVEGPLSEFPAANALSKHLHLDMMTVNVNDTDFVEHLPDAIWHYEYPISYHPNSVPFLLVSRLVRAHGVKAVLSGEGSDECFLGYGPIPYEDLGRRYRKALAQIRTLVHRVPKLGKALWPSDSGHYLQVQDIQQNFEVSLDRLAVESRVAEIGLNLPSREHRSLHWLGYHLRSLLHRNDSLGMAASIEARFPYLDNALVQAAVSLPYRLKIRPSLSSFDRAHPLLRDKWIVRKIADRYIPRQLSQRKKIGFPVNAFERMRVPNCFFDRGFVADHYRLGDRQMRYMLDSVEKDLRNRLFMLEIWGRLFLRRESTAELSGRLMGQVVVDPVSKV